MFIGLHPLRDDQGRLVFFSESEESDTMFLLISRNPIPYFNPGTPFHVIPDMPPFKTNTEAEAWLRANTSLLDAK